MKTAKQILEDLYNVYNLEEESEENLTPENRAKYNSQQIRNIMLETIMEFSADMTDAIIIAMNNMPDSWIIEFLETVNGDVVEKVNESISEDIEMKHEGILEIPEDKKFWQLPIKHYEELVNKKGYAEIIKALNNLKVWNKNNNPDISKKASDIMDKLSKKFKEE